MDESKRETLAMAKIGLALSGGGFRGTLFHLGVVRFLRDAGVLRDVTHITSVSGGSILAAHLVLNWERYNGSPEEFEEAAQEIIRFVGLDVRNRIVRRFPFAAVAYAIRWLARRPTLRRLTRSGLLEGYYEKYLYGATCLYELPAHPELHILSTNLSEGCICSFTRSGLIMQRRLPGDRVQFERIQAGLASVPLAVAASSAFPAFFPPIKLHAADIGASTAAFSRQTFTDGGVYDNLGIRAFRFIERCWSEECRPTEATGREMEVEHIRGNGSHRQRGPMHEHEAEDEVEDDGDDVADVEVEPAVSRELATRTAGHDPGSGSRRELIRRAEALPSSDRPSAVLGPPGPETEMPTRREIASCQLHPGSGRPGTPGQFDLVIASDAGAKLSSQLDAFSGGLVRTAMRASDILMDRVWQLEREIFSATPGFLFTSVHQVVEEEQDPTALPDVMQRQVIGIRTDLDRFSPTEIRSLVQHGYSVTRQACRSRPDVFGDRIPEEAPWDPLPTPPRRAANPPGRPGRPPAEATILARELQQSAFRRVVSTLFDWRDGMTYLFLPMLLILVFSLPAALVWSYVHLNRGGKALRTIAETEPDEARLIALMRDGPVTHLEGMPVHHVDRLEPPDYRGFLFLSDGHIVDLRRRGPNPVSWLIPREDAVYQYRHFLVKKVAAPGADEHLRFQFDHRAARFSLRCDSPGLQPVLKLMQLPETSGGENVASYRLEIDLDFSKVPIDATTDVIVEGLLLGDPAGGSSHARLVPHTTYGTTRTATMWIILPEGQHAGRLELIVFDARKPSEKQTVRPTRRFEALKGSVVGWQFIDPAPNTTYEGHWVLD
jgi:predicted acylesterase/phospholipase RssA